MTNREHAELLLHFTLIAVLLIAGFIYGGPTL
jgi:hypothetical protein